MSGPRTLTVALLALALFGVVQALRQASEANNPPRAAAAIEAIGKFRVATGRFPEDLAALVPAHAPRIPVYYKGFSAVPFRYYRTAAGFVLQYERDGRYASYASETRAWTTAEPAGR